MSSGRLSYRCDQFWISCRKFDAFLAAIKTIAGASSVTARATEISEIVVFEISMDNDYCESYVKISEPRHDVDILVESRESLPI